MGQAKTEYYAQALHVCVHSHNLCSVLQHGRLCELDRAFKTRIDWDCRAHEKDVPQSTEQARLGPMNIIDVSHLVANTRGWPYGSLTSASSHDALNKSFCPRLYWKIAPRQCGLNQLCLISQFSRFTLQQIARPIGKKKALRPLCFDNYPLAQFLLSSQMPTLILGFFTAVNRSNGSHIQITPHIGSHLSAQENYQGSVLREFQYENNLCLVNSFSYCEPAFYANNGSGQSVIDFIILPVELLQCVVTAGTNTDVGDELQLIKTAARKEHRPVQAQFRYRDWRVPRESLVKQNLDGVGSSVLWDKDKLAFGVAHGVCREEFLREITNTVDTEAFNAAIVQGSIREAWSELCEPMKIAGKQFFERQKSERFAVNADTAAAIDERRQARFEHCNGKPISLLDDEGQIVHLKYLRGRIKKLKRRAWLQYRQRVQDLLYLAWQQRESADAWRISRGMAGGCMGPKLRRYNIPPSEKPSLRAWKDCLSQTSNKGGCLAFEVDWSSRYHSACDEAISQPLIRRDIGITAAALEYFNNMQRSLRRGGLRRSPPPWSVPLDIWRMLFNPQQISKPTAFFKGIGTARATHDASTFRSCIVRLLSVIRVRKCTPMQWHLAHVFFFSKKQRETCVPRSALSAEP